MFRWCPSSKAFIPLFAIGSPSFLSNPRVSRGVCSCCEGPCPPNVNFSLFKDHYYFACFSSFKFVLAMFRFFDGVLVIGIFGFFFKHV
jgi:hypothetical protein